MKKLLVILFAFALLSCAKKENTTETKQELPVLTPDVKVELTLWSWNVALKGLESVVPAFNKIYPNVTIKFRDFGSPQPSYERGGVVLASGQGVPDIMQIENDYVQSFAEVYPQRFFDFNGYVDPDWESKVDPSKIPTSYDSTGRLVAIPWDSGPEAMYYRADMFEQAGINPDSIVTWDDYINAGKKIQAKFPNTKMTGWGYTGGDGIYRALMVANNTYYLTPDGKVALSGKKSVDAMKMVKRLIDEGLTMNTVNFDGQIRACKDGSIATLIQGGWWGGTLKDQVSEQKGKWRIMRMPLMEGAVRASSEGGSALTITASDPLKQAVALEFVKFALLNVDSQWHMYNNFGLFPSYMPVFDDPRFKSGDPYFGNQEYNKLLGEIMKDIPPAIYNSEDYASIREIATAAFENITNNNADVEKTLTDAANQVASSTGREIAN